MTLISSTLTKFCWSALGGKPSVVDAVDFRGAGGLISAFAVTDIASAAIATAALSVAELLREVYGATASIVVDRRMSSLWFGTSLRPVGWQLPSGDPLSGDYPTGDGWIRLHTNAPVHRAAVERVLDITGDRTAIARVVARWSKLDLEQAVVGAGGCGAEMRSLDAYGWSGPWATRRGFDSLVQMSAGIADAGMKRARAKKPTPLPVQALDHATGYLMAATAIRGVTARLTRGNGSAARLSLARTARLLIGHLADPEEAPFAAETDSDRSPAIELTHWGSAQRLVPPVEISNTPLQWDLPAGRLGAAVPAWSPT